MIELVNGYVCHNCSEAALAKQGKDPAAKPGDLPGDPNKSDKISAFANQPAVLFDGALKGLTANPAASASPSDPSQPIGRQAPQAGPTLQPGFDVTV